MAELTVDPAATLDVMNPPPPNDRDAGFQLSLRLHHEIEVLYPRIEAHGAFFRSLAPAVSADRRYRQHQHDSDGWLGLRASR